MTDDARSVPQALEELARRVAAIEARLGAQAMLEDAEDRTRAERDDLDLGDWRMRTMLNLTQAIAMTQHETNRKLNAIIEMLNRLHG